MLEDIDGQGDQGMDDGSHEVVEVNMANGNGNEDEQDEEDQHTLDAIALSNQIAVGNEDDVADLGAITSILMQPQQSSAVISNSNQSADQN